MRPKGEQAASGFLLEAAVGHCRSQGGIRRSSYTDLLYQVGLEKLSAGSPAVRLPKERVDAMILRESSHFSIDTVMHCPGKDSFASEPISIPDVTP